MEIIEDEVRDLKREKFLTFVSHYNGFSFYSGRGCWRVRNCEVMRSDLVFRFILDALLRID